MHQFPKGPGYCYGGYFPKSEQNVPIKKPDMLIIQILWTLLRVAKSNLWEMYGLTSVEACRLHNEEVFEGFDKGVMGVFYRFLVKGL